MGTFRNTPVAVAVALALAASSVPSGVTFVDSFVVPPSASAIARSTQGAVIMRWFCFLLMGVLVSVVVLAGAVGAAGCVFCVDVLR